MGRVAERLVRFVVAVDAHCRRHVICAAIGQPPSTGSGSTAMETVLGIRYRGTGQYRGVDGVGKLNRLVAGALVFVGTVVGWVSGVWLYALGLWVVGYDPAGGIHVGALLLGACGAVVVPTVLRRLVPRRFGGRNGPR